jgi:hypothetical protein
MSALVTPGDLRSALAVTRSLGRRGVTVTVADEEGKSLAGASHYCHASFVPGGAIREWPGNAIHQEGTGRHRVLIPVTHPLPLTEGSKFEGLMALLFPDVETLQTAHDKGAVTRCGGCGIPVRGPRGRGPADQAQLNTSAFLRSPGASRDSGGMRRTGRRPLYSDSGGAASAFRAVHAVVPVPGPGTHSRRWPGNLRPDESRTTARCVRPPATSREASLRRSLGTL